MMTVLRGDGGSGNALVTVQPMVGGDADAAPSALLFVRVELPPSERYQDPALMRRALMDDQLTRFGASSTSTSPPAASSTSSSRTTATPRRCWCWRPRRLRRGAQRVRLGGAAPHSGHLRRRQPGVDVHVPRRRGARLPRGHPVPAGHGDGPARPPAAHHPGRGQRDRPAVAARRSRRAAVGRVDGAAADDRPRHAAGLPRLHPRPRVPQVRRLRRRDRHGVRRPRRDRHRQRPQVQPRALHRPRAAAQPAAAAAVRAVLGRGPAPLPARQQARRGRRRLVRVDRAARRPRRPDRRGRRRARRPRRRHHGGSAPRCTRSRTWSCRPPRPCTSCTS